MAITSVKTVVKGAGALCIRRLSDDRLMWLSTNSRVVFTKSTEEGEAVEGFNSDGDNVTLDKAGDTLTYELEVATKKNSRAINEMVLNSVYVEKTGFQFPMAESHTVADGEITLSGDATPVAGKTKVSYLDGEALTSVEDTPDAAGKFEDNGDGTITFHADDNGKIVVVQYWKEQNVSVQGGADHAAVGDVECHFFQKSGTSDIGNNIGADIIWLPKCTLSGDSDFEFSSDVQEKTFTLTATIPTSPAGWKVPFAIIRNAEFNPANAG